MMHIALFPFSKNIYFPRISSTFINVPPFRAKLTCFYLIYVLASPYFDHDTLYIMLYTTERRWPPGPECIFASQRWRQVNLQPQLAFFFILGVNVFYIYASFGCPLLTSIPSLITFFLFFFPIFKHF